MLDRRRNPRPRAASAPSEELYRSLVQSPTELVCRFLPDSTLTFVNDAYCRYFGRSRSDLIGSSYLELMPPSVHAFAKQHVANLLETHRIELAEHAVLRPDGQLGWQQWLDHVVLDADGNVVELQAVGRDVTAFKRAELRLEEQQNEIAHLSRVSLLGRLTASLVHELSQPVASITSNAEAAAKLLACEPRHVPITEQILQDILEQARHAREVIQKVRGLLRRNTAEFRPLDLNAIALDTSALLRGEFAAGSIKIACVLAPGLPLVSGDYTQLQQVMLNLVINACDAMGEVSLPTRQLTLATSLVGKMVHVSVRDNGTGIGRTDLERIFDPYFTTKDDGLGLGLSICRAIIDAHRGEMWASRNTDAGTTFHFTLPALQQ